jgi:hypothetical protein
MPNTIALPSHRESPTNAMLVKLRTTLQRRKMNIDF